MLWHGGWLTLPSDQSHRWKQAWAFDLMSGHMVGRAGRTRAQGMLLPQCSSRGWKERGRKEITFLGES